MAKKTKLKKFHKIKIHHNRWLIWAIAYVLFVAIAMVGYLKVSDLDIDSESTLSIYQPWHGYNNTRLGFGLRYPANWAIEADSESSVNFFPHDSDEAVNVMVTEPSAEKSIRSSLKITEETIKALDQVPITEISNDLGNGHSETVILATSNHKLYVIRGSDSLVQKLLLTFHFLK